MRKYLSVALLGLWAILQSSCYRVSGDYLGGSLGTRRAFMAHIERSTVYIKVTCTTHLPPELRKLLDLPETMRKGGSGVVLRSDVGGSYILTAKHVVANTHPFYDCNKLEVFLSSDLLHQGPMAATIKYVVPNEPEDRTPKKTGRSEITDRETDIAVVLVKENLGVSNHLATRSFLGEPVVAAGFPTGSPSNLIHSLSITEGVLATKLFCKTKGLCVIRTSTQVYSGSSGGPLFNYRGEVVGVASFMAAIQAGSYYLVVAGGYFFIPYRVIQAEFLAAKTKGLLPNMD